MLEIRKRITRSMLKAEPDKRFVFGDNMVRKGLGGQAKEMRGESNAMGVCTKRLPSNDDHAFMTGTPGDLAALLMDLHCVSVAASRDHVIVWPEDGIGTGLADLKTHWPEGLALIELFKTMLGRS